MSNFVIEELERDFTIHRLWEASDHDAVVTRLAPDLRFAATVGTCPASLMRRLPKPEIVSSFGVGYDGVDVKAACALGIRVTNTPDVLNDYVAEVTLGLTIALAHWMQQAERFVGEGRWEKRAFDLRDELTGKQAGILRLGRIGKEIVRRLQVFRMEVVYHGRNRQPDDLYAFYPDLETMSRDVDWLVVIAPRIGLGGRYRHPACARGARPRGLRHQRRPRLARRRAGHGGAARLQCSWRSGPRRVRRRAARPVGASRVGRGLPIAKSGGATKLTRRAMSRLVVGTLRMQLQGYPLLTPINPGGWAEDFLADGLPHAILFGIAPVAVSLLASQSTFEKVDFHGLDGVIHGAS